MTGFCVARVTPPPGLLATDGVLRAVDLGLTTDAQALAARIVAAAEAERQVTLAASQAQVLAEGAALLDGLRAAAESVGEQATDIVTAMASQLFERLILETSAQERVMASYRRLLREAPPRLVNAVLRLHPDELALAEGCEWPVKADASLMPGACRLEADSGQWRADFQVAAASLAQVFANRKAAGDTQ